MLLFLSQHFIKYESAFRIFNYISFRSLMSCLFSLIISIIFGDRIIFLLSKLNIGQVIRECGPQSHLNKSGTPTMGGVLIIIIVIFTSLIFANLSNPYVWILLFILFSTGLLGFIDDYKKIIFKNSNGVSPRCKLLTQIIITTIFIYLIYKIQSSAITNIVVPFLKFHYSLNIILFIILVYITILGGSNAVNITDGLDGLVSFPIIIVAIGLGIFSYIAGNKLFSTYLLFPYIQGANEIVVLCGALIGSCLGFLWFNAYPARVFMGDVGSLSIGAMLSAIAIIIHQEIIFAVMSGVFVFEALSVILQVYSYKLRKKRIFLMAPLHHHFELKGWNENRIVVRFWIISIILFLISLSIIKIR